MSRNRCRSCSRENVERVLGGVRKVSRPMPDLVELDRKELLLRRDGVSRLVAEFVVPRN
jgi:hypothetical protein